MKTSQTFETIDRLRTLKDSKLGIKLGIEMYNAKKRNFA